MAKTSSYAQRIEGSVFSSLTGRMATYEGEIYPLHVGDTWLEPAEAAWMEHLRVADHPGMHSYDPPGGARYLREALALRATERTGVVVRPTNIQLAAGATAGLAALMGAVLDPDDEVLVLSPHWPLIAGIVRTMRGTPVLVEAAPDEESSESLTARLAAAAGERTVALYISSPNNPTGRILPRAHIETMSSWAKERGIWLVSDEVYEDLAFDGDVASAYDLNPEGTVTAHSFSKGFGMAGNRVGWLVGPEALMQRVGAITTHTHYSTPTAGCLAAARALSGEGQAWQAQALERYRKLAEWSARTLDVPMPAAGTFLFLDVAEHLDERGLMGFLEDLADDGLFVAPGPSFGPYPHSIRVCFTSAAPGVVRRGIEVLARHMSRSPGETKAR